MFRLLFPISFSLWLFILGSLFAPEHSKAKYAHIVIDAETGRTLHSLNARTRNYPASLTKIMTLYMTFDALSDGTMSLGQKLPVSRISQGRSPSKLGLRRGERISVNDAIKALVVKSANDAATVLAEALGGTERKFAIMMTRRARALGMKNTIFKNASGLPHRRQLSTAEDMAILARSMLYQHRKMYHYFSHATFTYRGRTYRSHNQLMKRYEGMDGIKTGYIRASGFNLVASAKRNGQRVIAVVFGGKTAKLRDRQMERLLNRGFAKLNKLVIASNKEKSVVDNPSHKIGTRKAQKKPRSGKIVLKRTGKSKDKTVLLGPTSEQIQSWAIQVGAFNRFGSAYTAIKRAERALPSLWGSEVRIVRQKSKFRRGLSIYKARLLISTASKARNSCKALKRRKIDCMVVWMGPESGV